MLRVIRSLLLKIVDDIDAGNSNISEGEAIEMAENIVERSLICTRLRKFVKDIGEYSQHL